MYDYAPINALEELRHQLEHEGFVLPTGFHAKNDAKPMKSRVFDLLSQQPIYIHSVALKKEKVYPELRPDAAFVYRIACRMLFRSLLKDYLADRDKHSIVFSKYASGKVAARLESFQIHMMKEFGSFHRSTRIAFWDAASHAGLQIADYCSWMTQRDLENPTDAQAMQFKQCMDSRVVTLFKPFG